MRAYWLAIVVWGLAGIFLILVLIPTPIYMSIYKEATQHAQQNCELRNSHFWVAFWKIYDVIFNAALWTAAATIAIAGFTWRLKRSTDELWNVTKEALIAVERAFVSIEKFDRTTIMNNIIVDGWQFSARWINSGTTPTKDMLTHISYRFERDALPDDFDYPDLWLDGIKNEYAPMFLAPKGSFIGGVVAFSVAQLEEIRIGKKTLFIWGWADYNDVFANTPRHRTEFCVQVTVPGDPRIPNDKHVAFNIAWKHNGAEGECFHRPKPYSRTPDQLVAVAP